MCNPSTNRKRVDMNNAKNIAIIGGGWAGMAAAVTAAQAGHRATVFEASQALGGRARVLNATLPDGTPVTLDNGQHILIGAYSQTLQLMQHVGVNLATALLRLPLTLQFPDGKGLRLPALAAPLDAAWGIATARGWTWRDKLSLLRAATGWQRAGFRCAGRLSVAQLCQQSPNSFTPRVTQRVMAELIEPLCASALNTPAQSASAQVFLRVLQDAMFSKSVSLQSRSADSNKMAFGSSNLLLPRLDLSNLFPHAAAAWLIKRGAQVRLGDRVESLEFGGTGWQVSAASGRQTFDAVILAGSASNMAKAVSNTAQAATNPIAEQINHLIRREAASWLATVDNLRYEAITTVYAYAKGVRLQQPMLALRCDAGNPAQFVFDRGQLGGPAGLLAFVVSASQGEREVLQRQVLDQGAAQLHLPELQAVQTIVEKRATFACTPNLQRPGPLIAPGLLVCGDYVAGPYPATLEGAVRSAQTAVRLL